MLFRSGDKSNPGISKPKPEDGQEDADPQDGEAEGEDEGELVEVIIGGKRYDVTQKDEHDRDGLGDMTPEQQEALSKEVDNALQQAAIMAGMLGANIPQAIRQAMIGSHVVCERTPIVGKLIPLIRLDRKRARLAATLSHRRASIGSNNLRMTRRASLIANQVGSLADRH